MARLNYFISRKLYRFHRGRSSRHRRADAGVVRGEGHREEANCGFVGVDIISYYFIQLLWRRPNPPLGFAVRFSYPQ